MRSLVLFSALLLSAVTAQAQTTSTSPPPASTLIPVGSNCTSSSQCRESAECLTSVCGNTGATCTYNAQCAFNLCDTNTNTCSGALILGALCTSSAQCAYGADCYAVNSMLIARCGNFQATCTNSSQCAYNTCVNGFCNGQLALGTICVSSEQCVNGAECYAPMKDAGYAYCGAWNASCTADNQCAWNTCLQGTCSGAIPLGQSCHLYTSVCANGAYCYSPSKYTDGVCGAYYAPCMNDTQCWDHSCLRGSCSGTLFNGTSSSSSSSSSSSMSSTSSSSTSLSTSSSSSTSEPTYPNNTITSTSTRTSLTTLTSCPPSVECSGQTTKWTGSEGPTSCPASMTCVVVYATGSVVTVSQTTVVTGSGKATGSASPTATPILVPASGALGMDEVATEGYIVALIGAVVVAFGMGLL